MNMTNKTYNAMKWIVLTVLPAAAACISMVGGELNWEHTQITVTILNAVTLFLGASLGISSVKYNKGGDKDE